MLQTARRGLCVVDDREPVRTIEMPLGADSCGRNELDVQLTPCGQLTRPVFGGNK